MWQELSIRDSVDRVLIFLLLVMARLYFYYNEIIRIELFELDNNIRVDSTELKLEHLQQLNIIRI